MENKYYTPTIEEFYVGFEYELYETVWEYEIFPPVFQLDGSAQVKVKTDPIKKTDWIKHKYDGTDFTFANDELMEIQFSIYTVRIKYLDKEDIESLGWKYGSNNMYDILDYEDVRGFDTLHLFKRGTWLLISIGYKSQDINSFATIFAGNIKNKSELKRVMIQLGICK